eukprot:g18796.t1
MPSSAEKNAGKRDRLQRGSPAPGESPAAKLPHVADVPPASQFSLGEFGGDARASPEFGNASQIEPTPSQFGISTAFGQKFQQYMHDAAKKFLGDANETTTTTPGGASSAAVSKGSVSVPGSATNTNSSSATAEELNVFAAAAGSTTTSNAVEVAAATGGATQLDVVQEEEEEIEVPPAYMGPGDGWIEWCTEWIVKKKMMYRWKGDKIGTKQEEVYVWEECLQWEVCNENFYSQAVIKAWGHKYRGPKYEKEKKRHN